jgi:hypothetical protein
MTPPFKLVTTERFEAQAGRLPNAVFEQLEIRLSFLEANPRHPSLKTHEVKGAIGDFGGKIFEAYLTVSKTSTSGSLSSETRASLPSSVNFRRLRKQETVPYVSY